MRYFMLVSSCLALIAACESDLKNSKPEEILRRVVPKGINIEEHPDARAALLEQIGMCGEGVVEGAQGENKCTHKIKIDETFLQPLREKTGFIYDPNWPYEAGIQWMKPSKEEMENVPTAWDLKEHGEMIRIFRQKCGDCWAQASRANLEQLILTHTGQNIPLSTQTLISSCCNTGSCGGGYMTTPGWIVEHGLPLESRDPYKGTNSSCKFNLSIDKMDFFMMKAPYIGESLRYSRAIPVADRVGAKVAETQAMMIKYKSSAVVTIAAIDSSGGIITNCSSINSGGNHMQDIVGWYESGGENIARVQNSWGLEHGQEGYTHIKWECGDGKHNRGLGYSARVGVYNMPLECKHLPDAYTGKNVYMKHRGAVQLGRKSRHPQKCEWTPKEGLDDPFSCAPMAMPKLATEYHLKVETDCGEASAMVLVVPKAGEEPSQQLNTPFGIIEWTGEEKRG